MKYRKTTTEEIEVVCVYDSEKSKEQHPHIYDCDDGNSYLCGPSESVPLQDGDWIVFSHKNQFGLDRFRIIPVAEQDGWEAVAG